MHAGWQFREYRSAGKRLHTTYTPPHHTATTSFALRLRMSRSRVRARASRHPPLMAPMETGKQALVEAMGRGKQPPVAVEQRLALQAMGQGKQTPVAVEQQLALQATGRGKCLFCQQTPAAVD